MRIGLAVGYFDPQVGGSEEVVKRLAAGFTDRGHDVVVATSADPRRDAHRMVAPVVEFDVRGNAARGMIGEVVRYQRFLLDSKQDLWLFYAAQIWSTDAALPLLAEIPASTVVVPCGYSGLRDPAFAAYFDQLPGHLAQANALVYMSRGYQDYEHDVDAGLGDLARIIPNGAADDEFDRIPARDNRGGCTVLCVANHYRPKGHGAAIRAFRRAAGPDDRLVIVGEVHGRNPRGSCWLDCRIAALRDRRIALIEHASRDEVVRWYKQADVFLFGSKIEAAPLVIVEAMAAALPFVTTPAGNVADYSDSGLVVPEAKLADALQHLLQDAGERERLGRSGRARWDRDHRWSVVVDSYERLFGEIMAAPKAT
jgi:glycosyltransferase involved in cell wall biosynthesis